MKKYFLALVLGLISTQSSATHDPVEIDLRKDFSDRSFELPLNFWSSDGFAALLPVEPFEFGASTDLGPISLDSLSPDFICKINGVWQTRRAEAGTVRVVYFSVGSRNSRPGKCNVELQLGEKSANLIFNIR